MTQTDYNQHFQKAREVEKLSLEAKKQVLRFENERLGSENQNLKMEVQNLKEQLKLGRTSYGTASFAEQVENYVV